MHDRHGVDMESPSSPPSGSTSTLPSRSRSSTKLVDADVKSLTSFNPFSEEDEHDQSSYTLVSSLFSRMRNTLTAPLASAVAVSSTTAPNNTALNSTISDVRRPSYSTIPSGVSNFTTRTSGSDRPNPLLTAPAVAAPPLVSLTPAQSELPTYAAELDTPGSHKPYAAGLDAPEYGTSIPGFPIPDDARSIKTSTSFHRSSNSVSKVMRRLRGEGLSRDYWMDDENCKECFDCKSVFTAWRRKHHCRICGQIFCSRCASNIIKGARFGAEGMIRVCNFCLERRGEDDDDDDRRSIISSSTTFPAHQLGLDSFRQSPFSASQFFGKADEPFNLYSITETRRPFFGSDEAFSRPETPSQLGAGAVGLWESATVNPAPFRRTLFDEEKDPSNPPSGLYNPESSPRASDVTNKIEFPSIKPVAVDTSTSYIQFPIGSPDHLATPIRTLRGPNTPYGDFEVATPFIRSRVQSKLDPNYEAEPGWRTRRESTAYAQELNLASMLHLKIMLRQMLTLENIPNVREWEETLLCLALRIAREMTFTASPHRQGQDMDVRRYVKIKKIPGGTPKDSEYVAGVVITKNVAHKQMSRLQLNPRVMLVTFPLEFSRVEGQYMHFSQIVRQEKEYLGNLASRIAALRPHVVLVEKSVSRLALDALAKHSIAVARGVKPSAIQTIARMIQGDVFSSMDKLALEPRLGHCSKYCIQTYDHPLIPGRRKTYMRFEGCNRDLGCTLVLRGGDIDTLRRIKKVTRFLSFVVRNLKLETHLWKDSVISLPSFNPLAVPPSLCQQLKLKTPTPPVAMISVNCSANRLVGSGANDPEATPIREGDGHEDLPNEEADQLRLTRRIDESLDPYLKTFIAVSATLRFVPPYPIHRMKELENMVLLARRAWEDEIVRREEHTQYIQSMHKQEETITLRTVPEAQPSSSSEPRQANERDAIVAQIDALMVNNLSPLLLSDGLPSSNVSDAGSSYFIPKQPPRRVTPSNLHLAPTEPESLKTSADICHQSRYTLLKWEHDEFRRIWEWYLRKNADDFVVEKYQCIHLRECTALGPEFANQPPCTPPRFRYIKFYGENDMSLGQFIEKTINEYIMQYLDPKAICTAKGCEQPLFQHGKIFTHNETKLFLSAEKWEGHILGLSGFYPAPELVTTWSACRLCGSATPFIPVSEEMQRYSFAKFLELHFYPADVLLVQGAGCQHNIYQHHVRYFAFKGMTLHFQTEAIQCHEFVYPPFRIRVRPEAQLEIKNAEFERLHLRNLLWYTGLVDDLKLISIEAATGEEDADALLLADINALITRAESEREDISRLINQIYRDSAPTDTLALNQVHAYRQDKIVAWQQDFDRLPKPRPLQLPSRRDSKRSSTFGSVRQMWPRRYDLANTLDAPHLPSASEAEETQVKAEKVATGNSLASSASEASESEAAPEKGTKEINEKDENLLVPSVKVRTPETTVTEDQPRTDPDSDSTIGAVREAALCEELKLTSEEIAPSANDVLRKSRLPRGTTHNMTVAELVKKYQDYLPAQGVHDLAQTALSPRPVVSESEQEYPSQVTLRPNMGRTRTRHRLPARKPSTSDFEQGYAANVAPRIVGRPRKSGNNTNVSRIPVPIGTAPESHQSSRLPSPEKRPSYISREDHLSRSSSPYREKHVPPSLKLNKQRVVSRTRDKPSRTPTTPGNKSTFRRPASTAGNKVSTIARHYERLGRETEHSRSRYAVIRSRPARPVVFARAKVEVLESVKDAIADDSESSDPSSEADDEDEGNDEERPVPPVLKRQPPSSDATASDAILLEPKEPVPEVNPVAEVLPNPLPASSPHDVQENEAAKRLAPPGQITLPPSPFLKAVRPNHDFSLTPPDVDRNSILKALSGFWQQPTRNSIEVDDPTHDSEHIFRDSSMVVRLDEPTSIIALALNSPQYRDMLAKSRAEKRTAREAKLEGGEVFMPDDRSVAESTSTWGVVNLDSVDSGDPTEDLRVPSSKLPWAISIESGGLTITCTVLYPEQFDALRRTYDCEKSMIESLSRCLKWNASGGKSGSAFLKTKDDRFIAKELSRAELQAMETFAPAYFDYMSSSVHSNRPTLLAKVFGCYKVTFKKTGTDKTSGKPKSTQMNLLVQENLFYDRRFSRIYDLKGSTRNRHVQSTGRENEVLLDENLVETANRNPYYIREHSKRILRGALCGDSKFLADINVMDYSLVCGVDSSKNELVVGIVDYIRTYTWDKKLESWVKDLGGAGRGEPTIVTPRQYRQRFLSAMERYFTLVPDRWMKQADAPEEDPNLGDHWPDW